MHFSLGSLVQCDMLVLRYVSNYKDLEINMVCTICLILVLYDLLTIGGQKIVKVLTFVGQRIVGLCKSLTLNAVNF